MEKNENTNKKNENVIIISKDPIYNEIQEILTDQEMIKKKLLDQNELSYNLELTFPGELILQKHNVNFLLIIPKNYPKTEPELYCLTVFSHPHLCDGRNLINDIFNKEWTYDNIPIDVIINRIPKFIIKNSEYNNKSLILGKYMMSHLYPISLLKNLPIFFHLIPENNNIITIGDISLCLYELEKENNFKNCKLISFINIKDIIEIQTKQKTNLILIKYKCDKTTKKLNINSQNVETIENILKEKMKIYKKKKGKLPDIDIKYLEKEIAQKEKELLNKENGEKNIVMYKEKCLRLMDLYQQSIEYYSAVNDPKFMDINIKIRKLIESNKLTSNSDNEIKDNDKEQKIKEEKENISIKNEDNKIKNNNETKKIEEKKDINIIKKEEKKDINKKEIINNKINEKKEEKEKEKKKEETKKEKKEENKKVVIKENKDKKDKDDNNSLRLKIDEGEINTLDVGEDEEEEEEEDDDDKDEKEKEK
jgi:hypothetical protein